MSTKTPTSCEHCPSQMDCANLYTALQLLRTQGLAGPLEHELRGLEEELAELSYAFPNSQSHCLLSHDNQVTRELVARAIEMIRRINSENTNQEVI